MRVEFGAGQQDNLEQILEEQFPNVDIVLRHDGSTSSVYTVRENLEAGTECDFILSRRLPAISDVVGDYLLDLSSESFVENYFMTAVESCTSAEGNVYYLPGPSDVYGIVYDKTLFEENGWELPDSYSGFVELLNEIGESEAAQSGQLTPFAASLMYPDMMQVLFNTYGYEDVYAGSANFSWLTSYQKGETTMAGHMEPAVEKFKKLFDDGILTMDALERTPSQRSEMLYSQHSTAMVIECQNAVTYAENYSKESDEESHEIAMMPFWVSDEEDSDYLYAIPSYYMAINKKSAEESEEKKQILLDIYAYLSSVEGQEALMGDNFQVSSIADVPMTSNSFSENILETVQQGHLINTFYLADGETDKQVERQMLKNIKDLVTGAMSDEEWMAQNDQVRDQYLAGELNTEESYGQVETTLTRLETAYTMAEMYRDTMGVDIGICYGGGWSKSTNGYLYQGDITDSSLSCITPVKEEQAEDSELLSDEIVTATFTGQQIIDILNSDYTITNTYGFSTYYVAAGLDVVFNPWGDAGERVISCKLPDGSDLDPEQTYEVAYFNGSLPDLSIEPERRSELTWQEAFLQWLDAQGGTVTPPDMTLTLQYESGEDE
jgi:ABC-type glycerol-3-phosphate transport system substrate-binding protein